MENAAKALEIAAGVLLGVLLFAAVAYFFNSIGSGPEQQEKSLSAEQLAKFNIEYEVYNKKRMYGVDVISCLNKAQSNNEKYVKGEGFLTGKAYGDEFIIDVSVTINTKLEENLRIYKIEDGKTYEILGTKPDPSTLVGKYNPTMAELHFKFPDSNNPLNLTRLNATQSIFANFKTNDNKEIECLQPGTPYTIGRTNSDILVGLLKFSDDNMKQIKYNTTGKDLDVWSSIEWETALYTFKKKRFKCTNLTYSPTTGRVNQIDFCELDS